MDAPPTFFAAPCRKSRGGKKTASSRRQNGDASKASRSAVPPHQQASHCVGCLCYDPHLFPIPVPFVGPENVGVCRKHYMWLRRHFGLEKASLHSKCQRGEISSRCAKLLAEFEKHGVAFPLKPGTVPPSPPTRRKASRAASQRAQRSHRASRAHRAHKPHRAQRSHRARAAAAPVKAEPQPVAAASSAVSARRRHAPACCPHAEHTHSHAPCCAKAEHAHSHATVCGARPPVAPSLSPTVPAPPLRSLSPDAGLASLVDFGRLDFDIGALAGVGASPVGLDGSGSGDDDERMVDAFAVELEMQAAELQAAERARQAKARADAAAAAVQRRARTKAMHAPPARTANPQPHKRACRAPHGLPMYVPTAAKTSKRPPLLKPGTIPRHRHWLNVAATAAPTVKKFAVELDDATDTSTVSSAVSVAMGEGSDFAADYSLVGNTLHGADADTALFGSMAPARDPVSSDEFAVPMGVLPPALGSTTAASAAHSGAHAQLDAALAWPPAAAAHQVPTPSAPLPDIQGGAFAALGATVRAPVHESSSSSVPFVEDDLSDLESLGVNDFDDSLRLWDADRDVKPVRALPPHVAAAPAADMDVDMDMDMDDVAGLFDRDDPILAVAFM